MLSKIVLITLLLCQLTYVMSTVPLDTKIDPDTANTATGNTATRNTATADTADSLNNTADSFNIQSTEAEMKRMPKSKSVNGKIFVLGTFKQVNWHRALNICKYNGMELASIESCRENKAIGKLIGASGFDSAPFWTGGNDQDVHLNWYWNSNGSPINYTNWRENEPNNVKGNEYCINLQPKVHKYTWNDDPCAYKKYFVCEEKC